MWKHKKKYKGSLFFGNYKFSKKKIIEGLNKDFPCRENAMVITKLDEALMWSNKRKQDRIERGVEGFNKA